MNQQNIHRIDFDGLEWATPIPGMRQNVFSESEEHRHREKVLTAGLSIHAFSTNL